MKLKKKKGVYYVSFKTVEGTKELSTRCTNKQDAEKMCKEADVEKMEALLDANSLREDVFFKMKGGAKVTNEQALEHYGDWSDTIGKSDRTIQETVIHISKFLRTKKLLAKMPGQITEKQITSHINNESSDNKANSRRISLSAISNYIQYCNAKGWLEGNPAKLVRVNMKKLSHGQKEVKEKEVFTKDEFNWMISMTEGFWNLAVHLAYETGLRIGDICRLECASHNHKESTLAVWTEKRDKRVELPISKKLNDKLKNWSGDETQSRTKQYFFPADKARHEDTKKRSYHSVVFRRIMNALGIDGKSFHSLRATYATNASVNGKPWWEIAKDLGHSNVSTTKVYIKDNNKYKPVAEVA
jgi:integrase